MLKRSILIVSAFAAITASPALAAETGQSLYNDNCAACHQKSGLGIKGAFPALAGDKVVQSPPATAAIVLLNGRGGMPAFKSDLTDAQLAAVLTYIRTSWGNKAGAASVADIAAARKKTAAVAKPKSLTAH